VIDNKKNWLHSIGWNSITWNGKIWNAKLRNSILLTAEHGMAKIGTVESKKFFFLFTWHINYHFLALARLALSLCSAHTKYPSFVGHI